MTTTLPTFTLGQYTNRGIFLGWTENNQMRLQRADGTIILWSEHERMFGETVKGFDLVEPITQAEWERRVEARNALLLDYVNSTPNQMD